MQRHPRTLQIFNVYQQYGGEENVVRALSDLMAGSNWRDVYFYSRDWATESSLNKLTQPLRTFYNPSALQTLRHAHRHHQPDVWLIHNVLPVGSMGLFYIARSLKMPIIQYLHNYRPFSLNGTAWHCRQILDQGFQRRFWPEIRVGSYRSSIVQTAFMALYQHIFFRLGLLENITTWISQSHFQKRKYVEAGIDETKIEVLLPPRPATEVPRAWREDGSLLFLGRLVAEKGVLFLLEQWEEAVRCARPMPRLVIAGAGPLEAEVVARAAQLPNVEFVGHVDALRREQLLSICSAIIVPSEWWEVLGLVVCEAYEAEKPVLAARIGGLGEIVISGQTGFQFEPSSTESFRQALEALLALSPERRRELGQNGRTWLRAQTDPEQWKQSYLDLAARAVARKQACG